MADFAFQLSYMEVGILYKTNLAGFAINFWTCNHYWELRDSFFAKVIVMSSCQGFEQETIIRL